MMDDFIFRGRDIREFDASAAFGASMRVGGKIARSEYDLAGGGSIEIGEPVYQATQRQVTITPIDGREATGEWARAILTWLQGGRGELTVHNDPDVHRIAQFDADGTLGTNGWPYGALALTMRLGPFAYAQRATRVTAATSEGKATLRVAVVGGMIVPLRVIITPTSGTITAVSVRCRGQELRFSGLSLSAGQTLDYGAGDRYRAEPSSVTENGLVTFAHVTRWALLRGRSGDSVAVSVAGGEARVSVIARGRHIA